MSSVIWQNNLESSHLEGGESRSICFLRKVAAVEAGRMMWMNGLIACLFYVTSWEISIVYLLSCIWIWCLNLNLAPAAAARPGQAAAPGTLYNDVESPSSELVLSSPQCENFMYSINHSKHILWCFTILLLLIYKWAFKQGLLT